MKKPVPFLRFAIPFIFLLQCTLSSAESPRIEGDSIQRFEQAASIYAAHLDAQTDQDMSELMLDLARKHPQLMRRYARLMSQGKVNTATLIPPQ